MNTATSNQELFSTFYKGFQSFSTMSVHEDMIVFKSGSIHSACDSARKRIAELKLPLVAIVTSFNTYSVQPLNN